MRHSHRSFRVIELPTAAALANMLVPPAEAPPRCHAFRLESPDGPLLFLCDDGHDTLREYAVFDERGRRQLECITFSRCDLGEAEAIVEDLIARRNTVLIETRFPSLEHPADCVHCDARPSSEVGG